MAKERGSDLLRKLHGGKHPFNDKTLAGVAEVLELSGSKLIGWRPRGTPVWESIQATIEVGPDDLGTALQKLVHDDHLAWTARVFPRGIPAVERAVLELELEGIRQQ